MLWEDLGENNIRMLESLEAIYFKKVLRDSR
jgi:hypothetical protein